MSWAWDRPLHPDNLPDVIDDPHQDIGDAGDDDEWNPDFDDGPIADVVTLPTVASGGDAAFVYLVAFGADPNRIDVSTERHRVDDVPDELEIALTGRDTVLGFFAPPIGDLLMAEVPDLVELASATDSCIIISGGFDDPSNLDYLRNSIGVATAMVDAGAVAVYNLQNFALFSADEWRREIFDPDVPPTRELVRVLWSLEDEDPGEPGDVDEYEIGGDDDLDDDATVWVHTRGLRTFGRPDLSVRRVPLVDRELAGQFCNVVAEQLVRGLDIADGAQMDIGAILGPVTFRRAGDINDPDFNNLHLEIEWPT